MRIRASSGSAARPGRLAKRAAFDRRLRLEALECRLVLAADFGDAPLPYPTTLAENGAWHEAIGPTLGATRDTESDGAHSAAADADGADDDGVTFGSIRVGQLGATANVNVQNAPSGARLDAWIDFNADGAWGGPGEQIVSGLAIQNGDHLVRFDVPSWVADGQAIARFRLSTAGNLGVRGAAPDGEVEDYAVAILPPAATTGMFGGQKTISTAADGAHGVFAADVDGDGDMDVISASQNDDKIAWYENDGNQTFAARTITTAADGAAAVFASDLDGDGDVDILSASYLNDTVDWYENDGNQGFTGHTISASANGAVSVFAADMDGDGDSDVLSASGSNNRIAWHENNGSQVFTTRTISTTADFAHSVFAADVDGDGDMDILSASFRDDKIAWYENNGSQVFAAHTISTAADGGRSVFAVDIDSDGDTDVLSASDIDDKIAWYENNGAPGAPAFTAHTITTTADGLWILFAADADGDGDMDVLSASSNDDKIAWYENDGNQAFTAHTITTSADGARSMFATDMDGDGDLDVLSASFSGDVIAWYENEVSLCTSCADVYATDEDTTLMVDAASGVLANDSAQAGETLTAGVVATPTHGTLALAIDGSFSYTPNLNFFGEDSFTYRVISDQRGPRDAVVSITVNSVPDPLVAVNDSYRVNEDTTLSVSHQSTSDITLIARNSGWRYLDNGTNQGSAWRERTFDDAGWRSGPAELGYGDGGEATVVDCGPAPGNECVGGNNPNNKYITTYFRRDFTIDNPANVASLAINLRRDDGAVVYLNGVELFRDNMPSGVITHTTPSAQGSADDGAGFALFANLNRAPLVAGMNLIAVEIHQQNSGSSDISFDLELTGVITSPAGLLANDTDAEEESLTAVLEVPPAQGQLNLNPNGSFAYTPPANFFGDVQFTYRARDAASTSAPATVTITVDPVNDPPSILPDTYLVDEDTVLDVPPAQGVLANDSDVESAVSATAITTPPMHGTLTLRVDGSFIYAPRANFFGIDSFTYDATDGVTGSRATVTITVRGVGDPPIALDDSYRMEEGQTLAISHGGGAPVVLAPGQQLWPANGHVYERVSQAATWTQAHAIAQGRSLGSTRGHLATINSQAELDFLLSVFPHERVWLGGFHDRGAENYAEPGEGWRWVTGEPWQFQTWTTNNPDNTGGIEQFAEIADPPFPPRFNDSLENRANSTFWVEYPIDAPISHLEVVPGSATWRLLDDGSDQATAWREVGFDDRTWRTGRGQFGYGEGDEATLVNFGSNMNDKFVTTYFRHSFTVENAILIDSLHVELLRDDGAAIYLNGIEIVRDHLAPGADYRTYAESALDDGAIFNVFRVDPGILIEGTNVLAVEIHQATPASSDLGFDFRLSATTRAPVGPLGNDSDVDGDALIAQLQSGPNNGTLGFQSDGGISYLPNPGFIGNDTFTYRASDGTSQSNVATVTIHVVHAAPRAVDDAFAVDEDESLAVVAKQGVIANDSDSQDHMLTARLVTGPAHGVVVLQADGSFAYTPAANYHGLDRFSYRASDGMRESNIATVTIEVRAVNDSPIAADDRYVLGQAGALVIQPPPIFVKNLATGYDDLAAVRLSGASADNDYRFGPGSIASVGASPVRIDNGGYVAHDASPASAWIGLPGNVSTGAYFFDTQVDLTGFDPATAQLRDLRYAADNLLASVFINGTEVFSQSVADIAEFQSFRVVGNLGRGAFGPGVNIVRFEVFNYGAGANPMALRAEGFIEASPLTAFQELYRNVGLVHHWAFDETAGDTAADAAGNNPATLANWSAAETKWTLGRIGGALQFDGGDDYAVTAGPIDLDQYTFAFWAMANARTGVSPRIITPRSDHWILQNNETGRGIGFYSERAGGNTAQAPTAPVLGQWEHYAVAYDRARGTAIVYRNGSRVASDLRGVLGLPRPTTQWVFGHNEGFANQTDGWNGLLDDIRVYSRLLSDVEVAVLAAGALPSAGGVLTNDLDVDGDVLTAALVDLPANGALTFRPDGTFVYDPNRGYTGVETFTYRASDGVAESNTATVTIEVPHVPPTVVDDAYSLDEDGTLAVTAAAGVLANDESSLPVLVASVVSQPTHGALTFAADGSFTYVPDANFHGDDSFTYRATDGVFNSEVATVAITIRSVNDVPVAGDDEFTLNQGTSIALIGDGGPTTIARTSFADPPTGATMFAGSAGELGFEVTSGLPGATIGVTSDDRFIAHGTNVGVMTLNFAPVDIAAYRDLVVRIDARSYEDSTGSDFEPTDFLRAYVGLERIGGPIFTQTIFDLSGGALKAIDTGPSGAFATYSLAIADAGYIRATLVIEAIVDSASERVWVDNIEFTGTAIAGMNSLLANDIDADPGAPGLSVRIVTPPAHGTLVPGAGGTLVYTPEPRFFGDDSFTYVANDGQADSNVATVTLHVREANLIPVARDDAFTTPEDVPLVVDLPGGLLANDTDGDDHPLSVRVVTQPAHGSLTMFLNGTFKFIPAANYHGADSFSYVAHDGRNDSNVATATITISSLNDPPATQSDVYVIDPGQSLSAGGVTPTDPIVADSVAEFSGVQGQNGWFYGYYNRSADVGGTYQPSDFTLFPRDDGPYSPTNFWVSPGRWEWFAGDPPWTAMAAEFTHPNTGGSEHWTVRRWVSDVAGPVTISGRLAKDFNNGGNGGDGVFGLLYVDGNLVDERFIAGTDGTGVFYGTGARLVVGSFVDFVLTPNGRDSNDGSRYTATIRLDEVPTAAPIADSVAEFSDTQGQNNWYYGYYNRAADPDRTYQPSQFNQFPRDNGPWSATNYWRDTHSRWEWFGGEPPWDLISAHTVHPNGANSGDEHWPIRRWASELGGPVTISGNFANTASQGRDGVTLHVFVDGAAVYSHSAPPAIDAGVDFEFATQVQVGSNVDFAITPNGNDLSDGSVLSLTIRAGGPATETFVPSLSQWKYLDTGADLGTAWRATGYDDATWSTGHAQLGYGDGDEATTVGFGGNSQNRHVTTYFRRAFTVADTTPIVAAELHLLHDDGIAVYLNGVEVVRRHLGADAGYRDLANSTVFANDENAYFLASIDPSTLRSGVNTLAVEVHQVALDSSDVSFDFRLTVQLRSDPATSTTGVLFNDIDADSDSTAASLVAGPFHGTLDFELDGSFTYTPDANFTGVDQFAYAARDANSASPPTRVTINVGEVNFGPTAVIDLYLADSGRMLVIPPSVGTLANDYDVNADPLGASVFETPEHGTLDLSSDGGFTYTPAAGFTGRDSFRYAATDGSLDRGIATVTLEVRPAADPINSIPSAAGDRYEIASDGQLTVDAASGVLANDSDAEERPLSAAVVIPPRHGTLDFSDDGAFNYRPLPGMHGTDSFAYRATDGNTWSAEALVLVQVLPPGAAQTTVTPWLAGDANRDGEINAADVNYVLRRQFTRLGMAAYDPAADVNGDGRVSVNDAIAVRNLVGENQGIAAAPAAVMIRIGPAMRAGATDEAISQWSLVAAKPRRHHPVSVETIVPQDSRVDTRPVLRASRQSRPAHFDVDK